MNRMPDEKCRRLVCEGPAVIGMITSTMESGGSIESAIRYVASDGPVVSRILFDEVVHRCDVRSCTDMIAELVSSLSALPKSAQGFRDSLTTLLTAARSPDSEESNRLFRDSADMALESVRLMGERYSASLNTPCMIVFGMGIMVPMLLMSILPLLGMGGVFTVSMINDTMVSVVTLIVIPSAMLAMCLWLRNANPFSNQEGYRLYHLVPLASAIPLCIINYWITESIMKTMIMGLAPAIVLSLILDYDNHRKEIERSRCEKVLKGCFTDIGNRMVDGVSYEDAIVSSLGMEPVCEELSRRIERMILIGRSDVPGTVRDAVMSVSSECATSLRDICMCAERDNDDAGRMAITIGRQYRNRMSIAHELSIKLKGMTDMMFATAAVFAPLILGLSYSMMTPIVELTGHQVIENTGTILSIYLVELCALISLLVSCLRMDEVRGQGLWRFCLMMPVSLIVFTVCSAIPLNRGRWIPLHGRGKGCADHRSDMPSLGPLPLSESSGIPLWQHGRVGRYSRDHGPSRVDIRTSLCPWGPPVPSGSRAQHHPEW